MSARSCAILVKRDKIQDVERVSWLFEYTLYTVNILLQYTVIKFKLDQSGMHGTDINE